MNWSEWDGTQEIALTVDGEWNGTTIVPLTEDEIT
ncbi:hypothetical protein SEA_FAUST_31 [Streptomyces phage Faust]|uniref:Uncharacterized protein n=1 Tax=Streptomyces phage Faust TaxID=2767565 RepID=A0A7G9UYM9_9CAUD|nr:hypothetical protein PP456_gp225 [Streptomyces phage Faust]QNN99134.1 hypothetical protein SEA_FAUST_31 [Streptomyces phage Faust]